MHSNAFFNVSAPWAAIDIWPTMMLYPRGEIKTFLTWEQSANRLALTSDELKVQIAAAKQDLALAPERTQGWAEAKRQRRWNLECNFLCQWLVCSISKGYPKFVNVLFLSFSLSFFFIFIFPFFFLFFFFLFFFFFAIVAQGYFKVRGDHLGVF